MEKPSLSLQKALRVVVPMLELYWPLLISALCVFCPVPDIVQATGTVMLIRSTMSVLVLPSSAETVVEERIVPRQRVRVSMVPQRIEEGWSDLVLQMLDECLADLVPQIAIGAILQPAPCSLVFDFFM